MAAENQQKHLEFTFCIKAPSFHFRNSICAHKISSNTWNSYTAESQEEILFSMRQHSYFGVRHWEILGSSNCCIFETKRAMEMKTCTKIYFLFIFNLV